MALRGKKPELVKKRLKALFFGEAGVGKTTAALQFPKPYLIDTERGAEHKQYTDYLKNNDGAIFQTTNYEDLILEIKSLLSERHDYKTLIIDTLTIIYEDLIDKYSKDKLVGSGFGRNYSAAAIDMKRLSNLLLRLDMNVIIITHMKNEYNNGQNNTMEVINQIPDCYKKLPYLFDLVLKMKKLGKFRKAEVIKSRIESFKTDEEFNFSYDEISARYDKEMLEKESKEEELVSQEEINKLNKLIKLFNISDESVDKILDKINCISIDEMTREQANKWINHLEQKINE
jgi:AAA domain-containing protein